MIKNHFLIAWRNLWKNKVFSFINVSGLALGITSSFLIVLWISSEVSYDKFHKNNDRLYRVMEKQHYDGRIEATPATPGLLASSLQREIPEIAEAVAMTWENTMLFTANEKSIRFAGRFATENIFDVFSFDLIQGKRLEILSSPTGIVISKKMATTFFKNENPVGKTIRVDDFVNVQVTGVYDNIPDNSSLQFDFLVSYQVFLKKNKWASGWDSNGPRTFVLLKPGVSAEKLNTKIEHFIQARDSGNNVTLFLQKFDQSYLHSKFTNGVADGGRIEYVKTFGWVAILILAIACINFMNLSTARSLRRAREIGVRKVIGAARINLVIQFLSEAFLLTLLSLTISVLLVYALLPFFNELTGKNIGIDLSQPSFWYTAAAILLITGFLAGSYPALFLSSLKPINTLKGTLKFKPAQILFRKGLVVSQFTMSVVLVIGMLVVYFQMQYLKNKNLGFDRDNLVIMPLEDNMQPNAEAFKKELLGSTFIQSIAFANQSPGEIEMSTGGVFWPGKREDERVEFPFVLADNDYLKATKIQLVEGRDYSSSSVADTASIIVNEEAVRKMHLKDPVGKIIRFWDKPHTIIGVVKDFHLTSMHVAIQPFVYKLSPVIGNNKYILARVTPGKTKEALALLERASKKYNPVYPFEYEFLDTVFERQYRSELIVEKLVKYFASLAIIIACLGLLGLTIFSIEQRTKEITIRKVLGAGLGSIVTLVSKDFLVLVMMAFIVAVPVSIYFMNGWLQNFQYKITLSWWMFGLAGILAITIAFCTIGFQAIKAGLSNPVKNLRSE